MSLRCSEGTRRILVTKRVTSAYYKMQRKPGNSEFHNYYENKLIIILDLLGQIEHRIFIKIIKSKTE